MNDIEVIRPGEDDEGPRAWCHVMYALHTFSAVTGLVSSAFIIAAFVTGWPSIIAVIINYVTRARVRGTWLESHWAWQLRTFWYSFLWIFVCWALALTIVGIPFAIALAFMAGVWVLYRMVRGWMTLADRKAVPLPGRT
ncbi:MAG TPA: hypothetical protein PK375_01935 [Rhodocyclaceae bacterium]|nr:hypothetical protein [Rhodocyclaceae bacterium]HNH34641.1 hypothetical protein [Rhodocyclaceae bacterium]